MVSKNIKYRIIIFLCASTVGLAAPSLTWSIPISGQSTWETTLQARDLDGDSSTTEAFYDTTLNITWLADAALSVTMSFGVTGILANGRLPSWEATNDWIDGMNAGSGYLGQTNWRLPIILDSSDINFILGPNSDPSRSELAHLFYITLGNVANFDENGNPNPNPGLTNTALFSNFQAYYYWTGTEFSSPNTWSFAMHNGDQFRRAKLAHAYPLPILDGDVGNTVDDNTDVTENSTFSVELSNISANQNKNFTYSFCFENESGKDAIVQIETDIPAGTAFVSASGSYSTTSSAVIWNFDLVQADDPHQCVDMIINVLAAAGSTLIENATIQSNQPFIPEQIKTTTDVVDPTLEGIPASNDSGGVFGLLEFFTFLMALTFRRSKASKFS